jgi:hypothetical protein
MKSEQIDNLIITINMGTDVNKLMSLVFGFGGGRGQKKDLVIEIPQKF